MSVAAASRLNWWSEAACQNADPDLFFPVSSTGRGGEEARAKLICGRCPVRADCLSYAMNAGRPLQGIWGGTSEADRVRLRRNHRRAARAAQLTRAG
jgi:WhiB family transcriptional regulator, redox-sensing transcriptional regulator